MRKSWREAMNVFALDIADGLVQAVRCAVCVYLLNLITGGRAAV